VNQYIKPNIQFSRIKLKSNDTGATFSIPTVPIEISEEQFLVRGSFSTTDLLDCEMGVDKLNKDLYIRIDDEIRIFNTGVNNNYTGGNGITIGSASTIDLGGTLNQPTILLGNSQTFDLGTTASQLSFFRVNAIQSYEEYKFAGEGLEVTQNPGTFLTDIDYSTSSGYRSFIEQSPGVISTVVSLGLTQTQITQSSTQINILTRTNGGPDTGFAFNSAADSFDFSDNRLTPRGLEYQDDYSANFSVRSLIDKGYLDSVVSGLSFDLINDTTPQLGGNLDLNNFNITGTGSIDIEGNVIADLFQLKGGVGTQGEMTWNTDEETIQLVMDGVIQHIGQDTYIHARNNTASTILKGTPVMATGTLGASGRITIAPMIADGSVESRFYIGISAEDITAATDGQVMSFGKIRQIDLTNFNDGDVLWLDPTIAGGLTSSIPTAPNLKITTAFVIHAASNGTLFVRTEQGTDLHNDQRVEVSGLTAGQFLGWDDINQRWENKTPSGSSLYTADGTIGSGRVATLTDTLSFTGGRVEFNTTTDGVLLPRLTTAQMNAIASPTTNTILYNTDLNGLYRYTGSVWTPLVGPYGGKRYTLIKSNGIQQYYDTLNQVRLNWADGDVLHQFADETDITYVNVSAGIMFAIPSISWNGNGFKTKVNTINVNGGHAFNIASTKTVYFNGVNLSSEGNNITGTLVVAGTLYNSKDTTFRIFIQPSRASSYCVSVTGTMYGGNIVPEGVQSADMPRGLAGAGFYYNVNTSGFNAGIATNFIDGTTTYSCASNIRGSFCNYGSTSIGGGISFDKCTILSSVNNNGGNFSTFTARDCTIIHTPAVNTNTFYNIPVLNLINCTFISTGRLASTFGGASLIDGGYYSFGAQTELIAMNYASVVNIRNCTIEATNANASTDCLMFTNANATNIKINNVTFINPNGRSDIRVAPSNNVEWKNCRFSKGSAHISVSSGTIADAYNNNPARLLDPKGYLNNSGNGNWFIYVPMTTAERDALTSVSIGFQIHNTTTNFLQVYNGSTWKDLLDLT
jgi:hypothetical protein